MFFNRKLVELEYLQSHKYTSTTQFIVVWISVYIIHVFQIYHRYVVWAMRMLWSRHTVSVSVEGDDDDDDVDTKIWITNIDSLPFTSIFYRQWYAQRRSVYAFRSVIVNAKHFDFRYNPNKYPKWKPLKDNE